MKSIVRIACQLILLSGLFSNVNAQTGKSNSIAANLIAAPMQKESTTDTLPAGVSSSWYQQAVEKIRLKEYDIKPFTQSGRFAAANRDQQLGFLFSSDGYQVKRFDFSDRYQSLWELKFSVKGVGRNGHIQFPAKNGLAIHTDQELRYQYNGFDAQYYNAPQGMRQNFIIKQKPQGKNSLEVVVSIKGDLQPVLSNSKGLELFEHDNLQQPALAYDDLKAWDAAFQSLPAHMELDEKTNTLKLVVDDRNAIYPITIDPLNHTPDWTDNGQGLVFPLLDDLAAHLLYGFSVSGAGDVNNDTFDDIIIGAPAYVDIISVSGGTFNLASVGAAFIYYGSGGGPSLDPTEALQPTSLVGALFGFSVSKAGDINNDGFDDVVVGAPGDHVNLTVGLGTVSAAVGKVYIYYGNTFDGNINTEPVVSLSVNLQQPDFGILAVTPVNPLYGFSVSNAGDVNDDGFADIVVGSPAYFNLVGLTIAGRVDVYHGSGTGLNTTPARKITGGFIGGLFGYSVSAAGKVNNDAFDDIVAGAPASIGIVAVGSAYVFHGSASGITATSVSGANSTLQSPGLLTQTLFGYSVSNAGDVNGDGRDDVIIGEPLSLEATLALQLVAVGKAHIFYGSNTGVQTAGATQLTSPRRPGVIGLLQGNLLYGFSVSAAGDMNCDGLSDVIVGEPGGTAISLGAGVLGLVSANALSGKAYVYYGRTATGPVNSPSWLLQESGALSAANLLGASVSDAGDVNGDGNADLLIGAPNGTMNFNSSLTGIVGSAVGIITSNSIGSAYSYFGCLADADLDFDNDGIPDAMDLDDDNDGTVDIAEYPGSGLLEDPAGDADGDGIPNYQDTDFSGCGGLNGNGVCASFDKDGDGVPNSFDLDSDNDGIPDVIEAGGVDTNGDGVLDNFTDTDGDGLSQSVDANNTGAAGSGDGLDVADFDGDGLPNALDIDSDGDGITDLREAGLPDADSDGRVDGFTDADGDGYTDTLDPKNGHSGTSDPAGSGTPALITPADSNNDGHYDGNPTTGNADNDTNYNFLDIDSDNDGITDNVEAQTTAGYLLPVTGDADEDGLADLYDSQGGIYGAGGIIPHNHDGADNSDYLDEDSDNDGLPDVQEGHDINLNGSPDDDVTLTGIDTDADGLDDKFDLVAGFNVTTQGAGSPTVPGSVGPLQNTPGGADNDWRNGNFVLPVTLVQFKATYNGIAVELSWVTATEQNSDHFEIQRSIDGQQFTTIGIVAAAGNSSSSKDYSFTDGLPYNGNNYYRLKMVDIDNHFEYSVVILVKSNDTKKGITVYPNPVKDYMQMAWNNMERGTYTVDILLPTGQLLKSYRMAINDPYQSVLIYRESNWKAGIYLLRISSSNSKVFTRKFIIE